MGGNKTKETKEETKEVKETSKFVGKQMSEEQIKEHRKAFSDIEECIALYKTEKKAYNKETKPKRRNQV